MLCVLWRCSRTFLRPKPLHSAFARTVSMASAPEHHDQAPEAVEYLRTLRAIRDRCGILHELAKQDKLEHFALREDKIEDAADFVIQVMRDAYPEGPSGVKFHSRWRHFEPDGVDRVKQMKEKWDECDALETARRLIDLGVVSVLLDAGAGATWKFVEPDTGREFSRSEGLGVASFYMFCSGAFSSNPRNPFQADSEGLRAVTEEALRKAFQVDDASNPLVGPAGRTSLLQRLGDAVASDSTYFSATGSSYFRPGHLVDYLLAHAEAGEGDAKHVHVRTLWRAVMFGFQRVWPATRTRLGDYNLGDVWPHSKLPSDVLGGALVPFHKLSQWLTYSLMEPLQEADIHVTDIDEMTGLAEYRNGGLLVDLGVLEPKRADILTELHPPHSEVVAEWRALTVAVMDRIAAVFRERLGVSKAEFPLVKILEAGTWKAGRVIAKRLRPDSSPPIKIDSDGTVF